MIQERTPTMRGTAEANATLTLLIDGATLTTTVDANGDWQVVAPTLDNSSYTPQLSVADLAGNLSPLTNGNRFTVAPDGRTGASAQRIYLPFVSK